ncbi:MAG: hypothetical protein WAW17_07390 [Rhodococcus sp. (in: high G+C Gram-positive bacteria)]|uniref:hypothetical protein n=1 Tax=Rhodococcus sp. TaxID=1831 RepID=UPI003BB15982
MNLHSPGRGVKDHNAAELRVTVYPGTDRLSARIHRQTVAEAFAGCSPGERISVDSLVTTMRRKGMRPNVEHIALAIEAHVHVNSTP